MAEPWDVIIVGGGAAGLAAALLLGRARRRVLVCDSGEYRNAPSPAMHGFPTRDGTSPAEFREIARAELSAYPTVQFLAGRAREAGRTEQGFTLSLLPEGKQQPRDLQARKLLLATGLEDELPDLPGLREIYGHSAWHCPYCDGFENAGRPLAVHGAGMEVVRLAKELTGWSRQLTVCTGGARLTGRERGQLVALDIGLREEPVSGLAREGTQMRGLNFADGGFLPTDGLFLAMPRRQRSDLAQQLGCGLTRHGGIRADHHGATSIPGLYVAGDNGAGLQMVLIASAQGSQAAFAINNELLREDLATARRQRAPRQPGLRKA
ncbi:NAD(P)/FAD-dependent oxidoreductase [Roseomonas marmotae]|uniref:Thioredoxin reductase n=1 Tax=Roseomonas marmotae TaxID=2768161 RepID=A0ABS3KBP3_9PROT|nr:NAD(P)/FAD-dependent oxidoreductase [Roseomonas marmotae]MBO1074894.1 NAD(P)/FAD-dependent oxidoreductase [Roseomonas marmotae]QTI80604.1 NAD(P)/FAD-dependent oxidoreductase [Roseomonas marmotae]